MEKAVGFDDDHAGSAIRMAIVQPEQRHGLTVAFPTAAAIPLAAHAHPS